MKALSDFLRPEFINRVDEVITFRQLTKEDFGKIAIIMLGDLRKLMDEKGIGFTWTDEVPAHVAEKSFSQKFGARNMRRFIQTSIEDKIAGLMIDRRGEVSSVSASLEGGEIAVRAD